MPEVLRTGLRASLNYWTEYLSLMVAKGHPISYLKQARDFYSPWMKSVRSKDVILEEGSPWITYPALDFLTKLLRPDFKVFEYGAGGSTIFYAQRVEEVFAIEHHEQWFKNVKEVMLKLKLNNCQVSLIAPQKSDIQDYPSGMKDFNGYDFSEYVRSIDTFADEYFDLVVVDGRARSSCIAHAQTKVRCGGHLMLDDSERIRYQNAKKTLNAWEKFSFWGPCPSLWKFQETTIWKKPL
jgi:hypothetical protein